jgi:16S rRNA (adenine1518-N6/adenine1519-N6)-dimethyltransferase
MNLGPLLARHGVRLKRRLGQHFLNDDRMLARIVAAAELRPGDRVLEIGPGVGTLTRALADAGARVTAVEIDRSLEPALREMLEDRPVEIIWGDALQVPLPAADKVVANLPYGITGPLVGRLLEAGPWSLLVLMVQREVALRALAPPGGRAYGAFTLLVRYHTVPDLVARVPRGCFLPPPEVDSAVLRLRPRPSPYPSEAFFRVVRAAFAQRRKMLRASLADGLGLPRAAAVRLLQSAGVDGGLRAEDLDVDAFGALAVAWHGLLVRDSRY